MEPLSAHLSSSAILRPITAIGAESSILRDGRLSAEVLHAHDDGTVLLRVGSERVPAKTEVPLAPGETLALVAEQRDGEIVLRMVSRGGVPTDRLAQVLGGLIGEGRAAGEQHAELRGALERMAEAGGPRAAEARSLLEALDGGRFRPGMDGAEFASSLGGGGQVNMATLLTAALATREVDSLENLLKRIASAIRGRLAAPLASMGAAAESDGLFVALPGLLERALRAAREGADLRTARGLRGMLGRLESELARLLAGTSGSRGEAFQRALQHLAKGGVFQDQEAAILRALVLLDGKGALTRGPGAAALAGLREDPLGRLFAALFLMGDDAAGEAIGRRFTGRLLEQLLNSARQANGEGQHFALPVPDGQDFTTAHLFVGRDRRPGENGEVREGFRVVVGVDFSSLGPVRADLLLWEERLSVRLRVERPEVAQDLRRRSAELEETMAASGLPVQLFVLDGKVGSAEVDDMVHDIRFLREHRLIDVEG